ncbi:hypothetical protein GW755_00565 [bacterium]|nr:hypothetical protein [bacterium]
MTEKREKIVCIVDNFAEVPMPEVGDVKLQGRLDALLQEQDYAQIYELGSTNPSAYPYAIVLAFNLGYLESISGHLKFFYHNDIEPSSLTVKNGGDLAVVAAAYTSFYTRWGNRDNHWCNMGVLTGPRIPINEDYFPRINFGSEKLDQEILELLQKVNGVTYQQALDPEYLTFYKQLSFLSRKRAIYHGVYPQGKTREEGVDYVLTHAVCEALIAQSQLEDPTLQGYRKDFVTGRARRAYTLAQKTMESIYGFNIPDLENGGLDRLGESRRIKYLAYYQEVIQRLLAYDPEDSRVISRDMSSWYLDKSTKWRDFSRAVRPLATSLGPFWFYAEDNVPKEVKDKGGGVS